MLKKTITYTDYNGVERTEDFYFNLNKAEIVEMEMSTSGGMEAMIDQIIAMKDHAALMKVFKDVVLKSYGEKDLDGKHFNKSEKISTAFSHTEAYSELIMELVTNADSAVKFVNGIMPQDVSKQMEAKADHTPAITAGSV